MSEIASGFWSISLLVVLVSAALRVCQLDLALQDPGTCNLNLRRIIL
jgi:hypothetical protein